MIGIIYVIDNFIKKRKGFEKYIKGLERKGWISRNPHPLIPFLTFFIFIAIYLTNPLISYYVKNWLRGLIVFSLTFAVLHLIVVKTLEKR
jgi:hypothetical protein